MNHTWKKNTCTRCRISRRGTGKQTLYSATLYDHNEDAVECWVQEKPRCHGPWVYSGSDRPSVNIAAMGEYDKVPGFRTEIVIAHGTIQDLQAGKPLTFSRVGAPDHVHTPRVPDGVTR